MSNQEEQKIVELVIPQPTFTKITRPDSSQIIQRAEGHLGNIGMMAQEGETVSGLALKFIKNRRNRAEAASQSKDSTDSK